MSLNFGMECELAAGTGAVLDALGLDRLHGYHCDCSRCEPWRDSPDFTGQADCTADGEIISRVLVYGTEEAERAIHRLAAALKVGRAETSADVGLHVHVQSDLMENEDRFRFWRLWMRYQDEVGELAEGRFGYVRDYNQPVTLGELIRENETDHDFWHAENEEDFFPLGRPFYRTAWVNPSSSKGTFEFRLWNATRIEWRMHLAVGVSVAMVSAAMDGVLVGPDEDRPLAEVLMPYLSDRGAAALLRAYTFEKEKVA